MHCIEQIPNTDTICAFVLICQLFYNVESDHMNLYLYMKNTVLTKKYPHGYTDLCLWSILDQTSVNAEL